MHQDIPCWCWTCRVDQVTLSWHIGHLSGYDLESSIPLLWEEGIFQTTLQGTNKSHHRKRKISFKSALGWGMLVLGGYLHPTHVLSHLCIILYSLLLPYPYSIIRCLVIDQTFLNFPSVGELQACRYLTYGFAGLVTGYGYFSFIFDNLWIGIFSVEFPLIPDSWSSQPPNSSDIWEYIDYIHPKLHCC